MNGISLIALLVFQVELQHHTESVISFQNDAENEFIVLTLAVKTHLCLALPQLQNSLL